MPGSAPRATLDNPYGPAVTFRTEDVLPPSALYVSMTDTFVALFSVALPGTAFTLSLRMLLPDGTIQNEAYQSTTPINPVVPVIVLPPVEGYLLSCVVVRNDVVDCSAWVNVSLYRGAVQNPVISLPINAGLVVVAGYVSELGPVAWPNSPVVEPGTGAGFMRSVKVTAATGGNWSVGPTSNQRWEVVTATFDLITSGAAGNRQVTLYVLDQAGNGVGTFAASATQASILIYAYTFFPGASNAFLGSEFVECPLPTGLMLDTGMKIGSAVQGLDAADAITNVCMLVREWMGIGHA